MSVFHFNFCTSVLLLSVPFHAYSYLNYFLFECENSLHLALNIYNLGLWFNL